MVVNFEIIYIRVLTPETLANDHSLVICITMHQQLNKNTETGITKIYKKQDILQASKYGFCPIKTGNSNYWNSNKYVYAQPFKVPQTLQTETFINITTF